MNTDIPTRFHLHMVSDATGETLVAISKAARVQYSQFRAVEHVHSLVRTRRELDRVLRDIEAMPGIVLYTLVNREHIDALEETCRRVNVPCVPALLPILQVLESYLGTPSTPSVGAQHALDADYFRRIEALNFSMMHDDGNLPPRLDDADIVLVGISRTSKTPTSIYLANRGFKTANVPLVRGIPLPPQLESVKRALVVGLIASADRIAQVRHNRVLEHFKSHVEDYVDRDAIAAEIAETKQICARHRWPIIDVTRRSIEETAAAILRLYDDREDPVLEA
ncbi:putative pyruvate, phosphate dikinase regulatory protein [Methyloligella halotolerans]|uniref:Putative pyruvate, phosphate dikinase regulatory protein n=1 Tax=Methyloligella halotolerans TaxID=1177755 RepID=A0A1E2S0T9_9HYPH|nr:pyruvate, water dikinase regulatory protein [Methyloligella halotolerans]ODA68032.1 putative pyruvate, phosphate dikinase regulatory protein [Methyloligella halotolerans]